MQDPERAARRYTVWTTKPLQALRGLRTAAIYGAEMAVRAHGATPEQVIDELRGVVAALAERWRGKRREDVLRMQLTPMEMPR